LPISSLFFSLPFFSLLIFDTRPKVEPFSLTFSRSYIIYCHIYTPLNQWSSFINTSSTTSKWFPSCVKKRRCMVFTPLACVFVIES
jgi:hypothetical protein